MKKLILKSCMAIALIITTTTLNSCGNTDSNHTENHEHEQAEEGHLHASAFSCPMKCEGDKTYAEAGKCPSCGMDLEAINEHHEHETSDHHDHGDTNAEHDHEGHDHDH